MKPDPEVLKDLQVTIRDLSLGIKRFCFSSFFPRRGVLDNNTNPASCEARISKLELLSALHMPIFLLATKGRLDYNKNWPFLTNVQLLEGDEQPRCTALLPGLLPPGLHWD